MLLVVKMKHHTIFILQNKLLKNCRFYLECFSSSKTLEYHVKNCLEIIHTKSVLLLKEDEHVNFQNFKRKAPFISYRDFECVLKTNSHV